jgi:PPOX class probable F420-dependent enzyme
MTTVSSSDRVTLLSRAGLEFVTERHLATLTTLGPAGSLHVTPVGFTWDDDGGLARVICSATSRKARNVGAGGPVALCQFEGRWWLALHGTARVSTDSSDVAEAVERYARRYRQPRANPARVAMLISVSRVVGSAQFLA